MDDKILSNHIFNTLPKVVQSIKKAIDGTNSHLTHNQIKILNLISRGSSTVDELANCFDVSLPTISESIDGLVKKNLVKKIKSKNDGRVFNLVITSKASIIITDTHKQIIKVLNKKFDKLTSKEKQKLQEALFILEKTFSTNKIIKK